MADVYKITTADGQEFAWHKSVDELQKTHPGAVITGVLVPDDIRGGTWAPQSTRQALAAEKRAAEPAKEPVAEETPAEAVVVVAVDDKQAKKAEK